MLTSLSRPLRNQLNDNIMKDIQRIIENSVFAESVIQECRQKHNADMVDKLNRLLYEKAQELGLSLYEICLAFVPEITSEIVEIDWYKEKRERPDMAIETTIRLVRRD